MIKFLKFVPLLLLMGCQSQQTVKNQTMIGDVEPKVVAMVPPMPPGMVNPCIGKSIITPTSFGYTYTNPCSGAFGAGTNGVTVTEIQTHPLKGPHQFATSLAGPWSIPASNSYVWKWSGPYKHSPMYFKGPPGAVTIISYWSRTNVPEVSYLVANS